MTQPNTHPQDPLSRRVRHSQQHPSASKKTRQSKKGYSHDISSSRRWHCVQPPSYPMVVALAQPPSHLSTQNEENPDVTHEEGHKMKECTILHIDIILRAQGELWRQARPAQWLLIGSDPQQCVERRQGSQDPQVVSEKYKQIPEPLEPPTQTVWWRQWASKEQPCSLNTQKPPVPLLSEDRERYWELNWLNFDQAGRSQGGRKVTSENVNVERQTRPYTSKATQGKTSPKEIWK